MSLLNGITHTLLLFHLFGIGEMVSNDLEPFLFLEQILE